jgi:iron complex transport system substrate-binding protein
MWILSLAGGDNIAKDALPSRPGLVVANYGPEKLLEKVDQIDVFISQDGPMNRVSLDTIKERDIYQILPAFKNGRVYKIPENLISRPTPSLFEGLKMMHEMIYPADGSVK